MVAVTPAMVKELRERTGAGLMDCKKALGENNGEIETAIDWLRKKGTLKAEAKSGRSSQEGLVALAVDGNKGAIVELNCETDFVARNEIFQKSAMMLADVALASGGDASALADAAWTGEEAKVSEHIIGLTAQLGENIQLGRVAHIAAENGGVLGAYLHNKQGERSGRIAVLAAMKGDGELARKVAMHIAAARPIAVKVEDLSAEVVAREKSVLEAQAIEEGKPPEIAAKMVAGRINRFHKEKVLLEQPYIMDDSLSVAKALKEEGGGEITGFLCMVVGEEEPA